MTDHLRFTWFARATVAHKGLRVVMSREELAFALSDAAPHHAPKADLPLLCPATFANDHRKNENVEAVRMLGLDIDERQRDPHGCIRALATALGGVEVFAHSTFSSEANGLKLRALVPYDYAASADEHRASWALVTSILEQAGIKIDRACSDPARGFYVWAVPSSGAYYHAHIAGQPWPVGLAARTEQRLRAAESAKRTTPFPSSSIVAPSSSKVERARAYVATVGPAIQGSGGSTRTFVLACKLVQGFDLSEGDALCLLRQWNGRCVPPWSDAELARKVREASEKARDFERGSMLTERRARHVSR